MVDISFDAKKVLFEQLAYSFGLPQYDWIMNNITEMDMAHFQIDNHTERI